MSSIVVAISNNKDSFMVCDLDSLGIRRFSADGVKRLACINFQAVHGSLVYTQGKSLARLPRIEEIKDGTYIYILNRLVDSKKDTIGFKLLVVDHGKAHIEDKSLIKTLKIFKDTQSMERVKCINAKLVEGAYGENISALVGNFKEIVYKREKSEKVSGEKANVVLNKEPINISEVIKSNVVTYDKVANGYDSIQRMAPDNVVSLYRDNKSCDIEENKRVEFVKKACNKNTRLSKLATKAIAMSVAILIATNTASVVQAYSLNGQKGAVESVYTDNSPVDYKSTYVRLLSSRSFDINFEGDVAKIGVDGVSVAGLFSRINGGVEEVTIKDQWGAVMQTGKYTIGDFNYTIFDAKDSAKIKLKASVKNEVGRSILIYDSKGTLLGDVVNQGNRKTAVIRNANKQEVYRFNRSKVGDKTFNIEKNNIVSNEINTIDAIVIANVFNTNVENYVN